MGLFGTDGVRGPAGFGILGADGALRLGAAFADALEPTTGCLAIARDTRRSGAMLAAAVTAGALARGWAVLDLGVIPTPGLSWVLSQETRLDGGVMITASHNPAADNGLKLFAAGGGKVSDALQGAVESRFAALAAGLPDGSDIGERRDGSDRLGRWLDSMPQGGLVGRRIVADSACGAGHRALPAALAACGAEVVVMNPAPDGVNINDGCGAVHPGQLARRVQSEGAWAGVALDGDGDRIALVDEQGVVHDGDAIVGFLAKAMQREGTLRGGAVAGTVTTNSGLGRFLADLDLDLVRTPVGDRHVAAALRERDLNLGGESSGHILTPDLCPSGDAIRVALEVLRRIEGPVSLALGAVPRDPSAKRSVRVGDRPALESVPALSAVMAEAEEALAAAGARQLLRYSGTEPLLRIQVEGPDRDLVERWADRLAAAARESLPGARA